MRFGIHVQIAGGLVKSLGHAAELKCEAIQLFSANPNSWRTTTVDPTVAAAFVERTNSLDMRPTILHTPYLLNLASPDDDIWEKSCLALAHAVYRAQILGARLVVTHIGSHKGSGHASGVKRIASAVRRALQAGEDANIALEMGSGAGSSIGSKFSDMADILALLEDVKDRVRICLDTAHLWGAGYDISGPTGVERLFEEMELHVGVSALAVVHLNDTLVELGSLRDRHHHIGLGMIGKEGFRAIVNHPAARDLPGIIETPADDPTHDLQNLTLLRQLAGSTK